MNRKNLSFRTITAGIELHRISLPRHRHFSGYATVVLAGSFEEAGYSGRIVASAGDVLIHPTLDCHADRMVSARAKLIGFNWPDATGIGGFYHTDLVDELARLAEKDVEAATELLISAVNKKLAPSPHQKNDWPDQLLGDLTRDSTQSIGQWAEQKGLARETMSRGFTLAYGVVPSVFRAEIRARRAWLRVTRTTDSLSRIATETGFADQAHMTRWIHRISGIPPASWRKNHGSWRAVS